MKIKIIIIIIIIKEVKVQIVHVEKVGEYQKKKGIILCNLFK